MDKKLNEAVAALRPQMVAALQRLVRRRSVEADPLPGKPFGEACARALDYALKKAESFGFETYNDENYAGHVAFGGTPEGKTLGILAPLDVVPEGSVNFAFLGQFAETPRDTIFTTEYSMRTGMEAVYTLLNVDRGVPEVWGSVYDVRDLLNATVKLRDGKKATDMDMGFMEKMAVKKALGKIEGTDIEKLLKEYGVI